jgi:hypothetical protein
MGLRRRSGTHGQTRLEYLLGEQPPRPDAHAVITLYKDGGGVRQRIGEFHLSTGRHNGVPRRYHDRHRDVDIADPFVRGELPDSGDRSRHRCHAGQTHFSVDVRAALGIKVVQIAKAKCVGGSMRRRGFTRAVTEKAGEIDETMRSAVDLRKLPERHRERAHRSGLAVCATALV